MGGLTIHHLGILINITPSMPLGVYMRISDRIIQHGDILAFCLSPLLNQHLKVNPFYFQLGNNCYGVMPFIKQVIAIPGDQVILAYHSISVNGKRYRVKTLSTDSRGQRLPAYPRGNYPNTWGYWVLGTQKIASSWDSRYFGPIVPQQILFILRSVWTWSVSSRNDDSSTPR